MATASGTFNASGEAVYYGTAPYGLTAGYLYANIGGTWSLADSRNNYKYQLGIALGATPSIDGLLASLSIRLASSVFTKHLIFGSLIQDAGQKFCLAALDAIALPTKAKPKDTNNIFFILSSFKKNKKDIHIPTFT